MVRNHYNKPRYLNNLFGYPKKDTGSITLIESDNPNFTYEVYDYRGIFVGYMGRPSRAENEVLNKSFRKNEENKKLGIFDAEFIIKSPEAINKKLGIFDAEFIIKSPEAININSINIINGINKKNGREDIF